MTTRAEHRARVAATPPGRRYCPACERDKYPDEFRRRRSTNPARDGAYAPKCRDCEQDAALRAGYGITLAEYRALLEAQGGCCAICGRAPTTKRRLDVDHDHASGLVRGLLCWRCNQRLLGATQDPAVLRAAAKYLEHWPADRVLRGH